MSVTENPVNPPNPDSAALAAVAAVEAIAQKFRDAIANLRTIMPDLLKFDPRHTRRIAASAKFADRLITTAIATVTSAEAVKQRNLFDVFEGEVARELHNRVLPLMVDLTSFVADVQYTINNKLAVSSVQALQTYKWVQHAAAQPEGTELLPYVVKMEAVVEKVLNRRKKVTPADPVPAPPATQGFLAPNLAAAGKSAEPEDVATKFEKALDDVTK
jgi:hypothetical protein